MMESATAPWTAIESTEVYQNRRFSVWEDQIRLAQTGDKFSYHYLRVGPGVLVVPVLNDEIILINVYRHIIRSYSWELPGGAIEGGEEPKEAAARELLEETGYRAKNLTDLGCFYPSSGLSDHKVYLFGATELDFVGQGLQSAESHISVKSFSIQGCIDLVMQSRIIDGDIALALLKMNCLIANGDITGWLKDLQSS